MILSSCDLQNYWNYTVKNESSKTVSYKFNNGTIDTLMPSQIKNYQINRGERHSAISNVNAGNPYGFGYSVILLHNGTDYTFIDNSPFNLRVINTLPIDITIKADNFIDNNGSVELKIEANTENSAATIYTKKPNFTYISNHIIIIDWEFIKDAVVEGEVIEDTIFVTIR